MKKIKRIGIFSFAKFQAVLGAVIGLLLGIVYSIGGFMIDGLVTIGWITSNETPGLSFGTLLAFGALIAMPAIFASFGFLLGLIESILYNTIGRWFAGLSLDLEWRD